MLIILCRTSRDKELLSIISFCFISSSQEKTRQSKQYKNLWYVSIDITRHHIPEANKEWL